MSILSFNNHYAPEKADYNWQGTLRLDPDSCYEQVFNWMLRCKLDKDLVHTIVMPGVREGIVVSAYHALMGHFPIAIYSLRRRGHDGVERYVWVSAPLQEWRDYFRTKRGSLPTAKEVR